MADSQKVKKGEIIIVILTIIGILETVISAVFLIKDFYGLTDLRGQIIVHAVIIVIWIVQGFIVYQMDWGGAKFAVFVILELLIGAFIFRTIYDMTDYVVKSAEMESKILLNILRI